VKVLAKPTGLQGGYKEFCIILRERDNRSRDGNYQVKQWTLREETIRGQKNVTLTDRTKIHLPPPQIKFGLIKIFLKTVNKKRLPSPA
jgi:hypothetical protein